MSNATRLAFGATFTHWGILLIRFGAFWFPSGVLGLPFGFLGLTYGDPGARFSNFSRLLVSCFIFLSIFDEILIQFFVGKLARQLLVSGSRSRCK